MPIATSEMLSRLMAGGLDGDNLVMVVRCIETRDLVAAIKGMIAAGLPAQVIGVCTAEAAMILQRLPALNGRDVSNAEWRRVRFEVFERDGYRCVYCDVECESPHADHIIPRSRGGPSTLDNLATACPACNKSKKDRTPEEWRRGWQ